MKLGIIGSGKIVHYFLSGLNEMNNIQVNAISTTKRSEAIGRDLAKKYQIDEAYTDNQKLCQSTNIDTVYIGVPNFLHYQMSKLALMNDKNVICEKPFFTSVEEAEELKKLADKNHVILLEAVKNVYLPNFKKIKTELPRLGPIHIVCLNHTQYSSRYDNFLKGKIAPVFDPKKDGGALMDLNVYNIHLAINLFGDPEQIQYFPNRQKGVDTSGILLLEYQDKQVALIAAKDSYTPVRSFIEGEKGTIYFDGSPSQLNNFTITLRNGKKTFFNFNKHQNQLTDEFDEFARIIDEQNFSKANKAFTNSLNVLKVLVEARKQAY